MSIDYETPIKKLLKENEKNIINGKAITFPALDQNPVPVKRLKKAFPGFVISVYRGNVTMTPSGGLTAEYFFEELEKHIGKHQQEVMMGKWIRYNIISSRLLKKCEEKGLSFALEKRFSGLVFYVAHRHIAYKVIPTQET